MQPLGHAATTVTYGRMTFEEWGRRQGDPYFEESGRTYKITDHHHAPDGVRYQAYECDPREAVEWRLKKDAVAKLAATLQEKNEPPEAPALVSARPKPSGDAGSARAAVETPTQTPANRTASVANAATDAGEPPALLPSIVAQVPDLDRDVDAVQMTHSESPPSIPVPVPVEDSPGMVQRRTKGGRLKRPRPEHRHDDGRPPIRKWLRENGYPDLGENGPLPIKGKIAYYDTFGSVNAVSRIDKPGG